MSKTASKPIALSPTDITTLKALYRFRYLTSGLIYELFPTVPQRTMRHRLKRLFDHNFIDKPSNQPRDYQAHKHVIYALGQAGADYLTEAFQIKFPKTVKWREKNHRHRGNDPFSHTLETARFMLALDRDLAGEGALLTHQDELIGSNYVEGRGWKTVIHSPYETLEVGLNPDGIFSVTPEGATYPLNFFLEIDRGTMPVRSNNFTRSSIFKKYKSYIDTHSSKISHDLFGFRNFRILMVTTSEARAETMRQLWRDEFPEFPHMILFTTFSHTETASLLKAWSQPSGLPADLI